MTVRRGRSPAHIVGSTTGNWLSSAAGWRMTTPPSMTRCAVSRAEGSSSSRRRHPCPTRSAPKLSAFRDYGFDAVMAGVHGPGRAAAQDKAIADLVEDYGSVHFTGGDQALITGPCPTAGKAGC